MKDSSFAELKVGRFLDRLIAAVHLDLTFGIQCRPESVSDLAITFSGPDVPLLAAHDGELLRAIEHLAARVGRLESERQGTLAIGAADPSGTHAESLGAMEDMAFLDAYGPMPPSASSPS